MEETIRRLQLCSKGDKIGWTFTKPVSKVGRGKTWDAYSRLLADDRYLVEDGKELPLRDIQAVINGLTRKIPEKQEFSFTC